MLRTLSIVTVLVAASVALPATSFAQMEKGGMSGDSMGGMKSQSTMMKKHKMRHTMHHGMMKKPMSSGGGM